MRGIAICFIALLAAGTAHAQSASPVNLSADMDGDGKPDAITRTIAANGAWQVMVALGELPTYPYRIVEGDDPGMGHEPIDVLPPGDYHVNFQGQDGPKTFANAVFVFDKRDDRRRLIFWEAGLFRTAWMKVD
jgi:hypothetical protein